MSNDQENTNLKPSTEDVFDELLLINKSTTKESSQPTNQISQNTFKQNTFRRKKRMEWTAEELEDLEKGMEKFGTNWSLILNMSSTLRNRTNVQLKDKARNEKRRREREGIPLGVFQKATG